MSVVDKIKDMLKGHPEQAKKGVDKGADYIDEKTQGKYHSQVDTAREKTEKQFGQQQDKEPPQR
jgi:hypothetical protein